MACERSIAHDHEYACGLVIIILLDNMVRPLAHDQEYTCGPMIIRSEDNIERSLAHDHEFTCGPMITRSLPILIISHIWIFFMK